MEKLKHLKEMLMDGVSAEASKGLHAINREELGEAIDMIKDIEEIIYYCSITKAMEEKEKENEYMQKHNYSSMNYPMYYVMLHLNDFGLPSTETVRRTRQKIQAEFPDLASDKRIQKMKAEREAEFRKFAKETV